MKTRAYIRTLLTILTAGSFAAACSKAERVQTDQEIVLSPFGTSLTKADSGPLGIDKVFGVYAYYAACQGGTAWNDPQAWGVSAIYLDNVAFSHKGVSWAGRDQDYYWPFMGSLMFAGYCPHKDESGGTITSVSMIPHKVDINPYFQIEFTQKTNPSDMVDLLWFDVEDSGLGKTLSKTDSAIDVQFKHAMSKVAFRFVDSYGNYKLLSVILEGSVNKGTFYSGLTHGWLPDLEVVAPYTLLSEELANAPLLNGWDSSELYIIPQYLDGIFPSLGTDLDSGVDVVLTFTLTDFEGFGSQTISIPLKEYTYRWELGQYYLYTVTVNSDPIEFGAPSFDITLQTVSM